MDFSSAPAKEEPRKSPKSLPIRDDRQPSRALPTDATNASPDEKGREREREKQVGRERTLRVLGR